MVETRTSIKFVRDFRIKPTEMFSLLQTARNTSELMFNLLQTARNTSELKHSTLINYVQSVTKN